MHISRETENDWLNGDIKEYKAIQNIIYLKGWVNTLSGNFHYVLLLIKENREIYNSPLIFVKHWGENSQVYMFIYLKE